jgi:hypothetical protein
LREESDGQRRRTCLASRLGWRLWSKGSSQCEERAREQESPRKFGGSTEAPLSASELVGLNRDCSDRKSRAVRLHFSLCHQTFLYHSLNIHLPTQKSSGYVQGSRADLLRRKRAEFDVLSAQASSFDRLPVPHQNRQSCTKHKQPIDVSTRSSDSVRPDSHQFALLRHVEMRS